MKKLGDSHNFGKFVFEEDGKIFKPRVLFWEYLFLTNTSPLRSLIDIRCNQSQLTSPFLIAPALEVVFENLKTGHAEKLTLKNFEISHQLKANDFSSIGSLLALCFWFGLGDLHKDNIKIGLTEKSEFICFPVDIECILDQMTHIHQTLLIPSERIEVEKCGLSLLWENMVQDSSRNKLLLIKSFIDSINLFNSMSDEIFNLLLGINEIDKNFIRVIPRDTKSYAEAIASNKVEGFFASELEQLTRNEIPYFFRQPSSPTLLYFSSEGVVAEAGFSTDDLQLPSVVKLVKRGSNHLVKLKTTILSVAYLAEKLNLKSESKRLGHVNIICDEGVISVNEHDDKIIYSGL